MLSRLILLGLQLIVAWFAAPYIVSLYPGPGAVQLFVFAVVFAVVVWIVGLGAEPGAARDRHALELDLGPALIVALIGAALFTWLPVFVPDCKRACVHCPISPIR